MRYILSLLLYTKFLSLPQNVLSDTTLGTISGEIEYAATTTEFVGVQANPLALRQTQQSTTSGHTSSFFKFFFLFFLRISGWIRVECRSTAVYWNLSRSLNNIGRGLAEHLLRIKPPVILLCFNVYIKNLSDHTYYLNFRQKCVLL